MDAPDSKQKVLIVEDDLIISMVMRRMVQQLGCKVVGCVTSSEEAITQAMNNTPDVILMDIRIDGNMDGIEATKKIQSQLSIPVIYITGNNDPENRQRAHETNLIDFLTKPVNKSTLNKAMQGRRQRV